eukprot:1160008-Pelagomonas_calceolata.AAC.11
MQPDKQQCHSKDAHPGFDGLHFSWGWTRHRCLGCGGLQRGTKETTCILAKDRKKTTGLNKTEATRLLTKANKSHRHLLGEGACNRTK